jgi:hypothetical protein
MSWKDLDWSALDRLRGRFLGGRPSEAPYWESRDDLAGYDLTYGERIGWKWDAVLDELVLRGWSPRGGTLLDWGCGSGVAGRRVVSRFGGEAFAALLAWDHSALATSFTIERSRAEFPALAASAATPAFLGGTEPIGLLVVSHVLNELPPSSVLELEALIARSQSVIWVEPGNRETSRRLGKLRDAWSASFEVVAPCTRQGACPILQPGNERHWCHHFASPPSAIFADSNWVKFGKRAGVDLRSLPYSFVALDRSKIDHEAGLSRIIGRPEHFKPYVRMLNCDASGLSELTLPKRGNEALCKELERTKRPLVYRWTREGTHVTGGSAARPGT